MKKEEMKKYITLILIGIISYWTINNINIVFSMFGKIINVLLPFILGGILAFILNIPMTKIEKFLNKHLKLKKKMNRMISIFFSLLLFVVIILFVAFLLIPELIQNIQILLDSIPGLINDIQKWLVDLLYKYPEIQIKIQDMFSQNGNITNIVSNILNYVVNGAVGFIISLVNGIVTLFTAVIFAIYILSQKEYLNRCSKKLVMHI